MKTIEPNVRAVQTAETETELCPARDILVIVPAYNEAATLSGVISGIRARVPDADIAVINDGSRDSTGRVAARCGVIVLEHVFNLGYGAALQTGFKYALKKNYAYVVQVDADGQHDPADIATLVASLKKDEADMVIGSRFLSDRSYAMSTARKLGIALFSGLTSLFLHQGITDCTSGFKGFKRKVLPLLTGSFYPEDYPDADVIIVIHYAGFRIKEVPVTMHASPDGASMHYGVRRMYYIFKMLLSILMTVARERPRSGIYQL